MNLSVFLILLIKVTLKYMIGNEGSNGGFILEDATKNLPNSLIKIVPSRIQSQIISVKVNLFAVDTDKRRF